MELKYIKHLVMNSTNERVLIQLLGSFCFTERLEKELHALLPPDVSEGVKVIPPPYGADTAWFGAKIIANVSYPLTL